MAFSGLELVDWWAICSPAAASFCDSAVVI